MRCYPFHADQRAVTRISLWDEQFAVCRVDSQSVEREAFSFRIGVCGCRYALLPKLPGFLAYRRNEKGFRPSLSAGFLDTQGLAQFGE